MLRMDMFDELAQQAFKAFAAQLRGERQAKKMTREELAGASGVNVQQIGYYERAVREIKVPDLVRLCAALGITVEEFASLAEGRRVREAEAKAAAERRRGRAAEA